MKRPGLILIAALFSCFISFAQPCTINISTFPYYEGFEADNGGWTIWGTSSDWVCGSPSKSVIIGAGEGLRCWNTGGLGGSGYTNGENAWILSPCFNFSSLVNPEISFKVFWETEQRFDGANLQYSLDNGNTWAVLGDVNSNTNCNGTNWYNTSSVTYIGNTRGWSGSVRPTSGSCLGGNGSGMWLDAKHTLNMLAGSPAVRFRFLFGAGTTCNAFDGFSVDAIRIGEAAPNPNPLGIVKNCVNRNTLQFSSVGTCLSNYVWNFGDPASGVNNTSSASNAVHQFSAPGNYTISLQANSATGGPVTVTESVTIIDVTGTVTWPGACSNLPDATITTTATGSSTPYIYSWNTTPAQTTSSITNIGAGNYEVVVNAQNACAAIASFTLSSLAISVGAVVKNASCNNSNGSVITNVNGGTLPYQYTWSNGATTNNLLNIDPGNYSVTITDVNNCSVNAGPFAVLNIDKTLSVNLGPDLNICPGQSVVLDPGKFVSYKWNDGSTAATYTVNTAGQYVVIVTDADGCTGSDTITISTDCRDIYFPSAITPNNDGKNDAFGPLGTLSGLTAYYLAVFDRYGNRVFYSNNPFSKWDGTYKGIPLNTAAFVWVSEFVLNGKKQLRKGSATIIR